jgi:hypothetical protein
MDRVVKKDPRKLVPRRLSPQARSDIWLFSPSSVSNQSMLTRRRLLWLGPSGGFMDFGFSVGFFLNSAVEWELDLFIQRPMLLFSASSAIRGILSASAPGHGLDSRDCFRGELFW